MVFHASRVISATFEFLVDSVVFERPDKKVVGINTWWVVALMEDTESLRYGTSKVQP